MSRTRQRRRSAVAAACIAAALTVAACGSDGETVSAGASGSAAAPADDDIAIGFVVHFRGIPFIQQIIDGAERAGEDLGIEVKVAGPPAFDADAQLRDVQGLVNTGVDGIVTSIPGTSMAPYMRDLVERGTPVATFNLPDPSIPAPYIGQRDTESGRIIGRMVAEKLSDGDKVVISNCGPGLELLDHRVAGMQEGLKEKLPAVKIVGPVAVSGDQAQNTQDWEQLVAANPDAKALIGACAPDLTSLGAVNKAKGGKFVTAGYDLTEGNLAAIESGNAFLAMGQNPFVQGYLSVKMVYDAIKAGKPTPAGFIESGNEIVTAEGGEMPYDLGKVAFEQVEKLGASKEAQVEFYRPLVTDGGPLSDYASKLEPLENYGK